MKKILLSLVFLAIALGVHAVLITTNLIATLTVSTAFTNGGPVAYYTLNLPAPQTIINTHGNISNSIGTNALMYCASITVTPTNLFQVFALGTNAQSETLISSQLTITPCKSS